MKKKLFIASSSNALGIANVIQSHLEKVAETTVWDQNTFILSDFPIKSLLKLAKEMDYALFIFTPDDEVSMKGEKFTITRDNVIFELGLFISSIGQESTFIIRPENVNDFHSPSDLHGLTFVTYNPNRQDNNLEACLKPACVKIMQAIEVRNKMGVCSYLKKYVEQEEPSLLKENCEVSVNFERAYNLLLYMFQNQIFKSFCAFDLAFGRWEELLRSNDYAQTFNISNEIFESMDKMFGEKRCKSFKRILVITTEQLKRNSSQTVLEYINTEEKNWHTKYPDVFVETKIFRYPESRNLDTQKKIAKLHDFAVFYNDNEVLSIIETTLTSPFDKVTNPQCQINTVREKAERLNQEFDFFWTRSVAIDKILGDLLKESSIDNPSMEAFNTFHKNVSLINIDNNECGVIIETGYFDLRCPHERDRHTHLEDAFLLLDSIQSNYPVIQDNIFLDTFINDLSTSNLCNIMACQEIADLSNQEQLIRR